jgi:hypothetical protein
MVVERRENDKQIEEVRDEANQVEVKVSSPDYQFLEIQMCISS